MSSDNHGQTPAAWTAVSIIIAGCTIGGVATVLAMPWLVFVGLGVALIGPIVGKIMATMGLGATPGFHD
ncbi:MAG: HGxxPAAW family protein [Actinomycetes bacterium]